MSDYISRESAMKAACEALCHPGVFCPDFLCKEVREKFDSIPAADVRPVKWIPVTERLPLLNTPVLATDGIEVDIAWMYGVPPRWITSYTAIDEDKLTHWMPLPQTPKEK